MVDSASPLFVCPSLSEEIGATVYLKPELHSSTGSYKDRMAVAAVAEAVQKGASKVVVASSGNQGLAIAFAARAVALPCVVLATEEILPAYATELRRLDADLRIVPDMRSRSEYFFQLVADGFHPLSVDAAERGRKEQPGKAGYEAIAREIVSALNEAPDCLILPVCYGDGCTGILRGFQALARERGVRIPRFVLVRATFSEGNSAYSIATDQTTPEVSRVETATGGESLFLTNEEFGLAQRRGREEGLNLELAAAGPLWAVQKLARRPGGLRNARSVVLLLTAVHRE